MKLEDVIKTAQIIPQIYGKDFHDSLIGALSKLAEIEKQEPVVPNDNYYTDGKPLYALPVKPSPAVAVPAMKIAQNDDMGWNDCRAETLLLSTPTPPSADHIPDTTKMVEQPDSAAVEQAIYCSNNTLLKPEVIKHFEALKAMKTELAGENSRTQFHAWADDKGFEMSEVWSSVGEPFENEDTQLAWEIWQASRAVMSKPQRITEQDAQSIITQCRQNRFRPDGEWLPDLLAKLNEHREPDYKAQNEIYLTALKELACLGNGDKYGNSDGNCIAQRAIAKASASTDSGVE